MAAGCAALILTACSKNNPAAPKENQARQTVRAQSGAVVDYLEYYGILATGYKLNRPAGVAVNQKTGEVFITSPGNNLVLKLYYPLGPGVLKTKNPLEVDDPSIYVRTLNFPWTVAVDGYDDKVYVSDSLNERILVLNPDNLHVIRQIQAPVSTSDGLINYFKQPISVLPLSMPGFYGVWQRLYVCDDYHRNIRILDIGLSLAKPINSVINTFFYSKPNGDSKIEKYIRPNSIIMDKLGKIWVSDNMYGCVNQLDPNGMNVALKMLPVLFPAGLAVDKNNLLFVSTYRSDRKKSILIYNPDGSPQTVVYKSVTPFSGIDSAGGIAIDQNHDTLYVCDVGSNRVHKFIIHYK